MTTQHIPTAEITVASTLTVEELMKEIVQHVARHQRKTALQGIAVAHGMSADIRVIKGDVTNLVIGDTA